MATGAAWFEGVGAVCHHLVIVLRDGRAAGGRFFTRLIA